MALGLGLGVGSGLGLGLGLGMGYLEVLGPVPAAEARAEDLSAHLVRVRVRG